MAESEKEIDVEVAGQHVRAKGYRLVDLIWLPMVLGIAYTCMSLWQHEASAQQDKANLAATLKDSNSTIAQALRESNAKTADAIDRMATEQRRSTSAMREVACLSDPSMKNRTDARDFCRRMARSDQ